MMKIKIYLSIYLSLFLVFFNILSIHTNAENGSSGFFTDDSFTLGSNNYSYNVIGNITRTCNAYYMNDDSGLDSGFNYYMKVADGKAIACDAGQVVTNVLNYKIGLSMSLTTLTNFLNSYLYQSPYITETTSQFYSSCPPVLKNGDMVGIALNNITGCRMAYAQNNDKVDIPSALSNDIYNYYINVWLIDNPETPDFINIPCRPKDECLADAQNSNSYYQETIDLLNNLPNGYIFGFARINGSDGSGQFSTGSNHNCYVSFSTNDYYLVEIYGNFNSFCSAFNLTPENNQISYTDFMLSTNIQMLGLSAYNISDNTLLQGNEYLVSNGSLNRNVNYFTGANSSGYKNLPVSGDKEYCTVYKNAQIVSNITNNVYYQNTYKSTRYESYNTSNDNSYSSNVENINNSQNNNTSVYNQQKTTYNETITENNYQYDNSVNNSNNTTIINNYYGDNGDSDGGDDDDDDSIWDALLKALGNFLKKIGELIGVILTGIIEICTSVLDAIASITESFTGVTDFISAIFGFLPNELVSVLTLGITLAVLISLIKMFRG